MPIQRAPIPVSLTAAEALAIPTRSPLPVTINGVEQSTLDTLDDHYVALPLADRVDGAAPVWDADNQEWIAVVGGGGGGDVLSVNGQTGVVTLEATDIGLDPLGMAVVGSTTVQGGVAELDTEVGLHAIALDFKVDHTQTLNNQTGTSYTLVYEDSTKLVTLSNAGAITLTVPPYSSVDLPIGSWVDLLQLGAGAVTVTPGSGVTIRATPSAVFRAQYSGATLVKIDTDVWSLVGDLA